MRFLEIRGLVICGIISHAGLEAEVSDLGNGLQFFSFTYTTKMLHRIIFYSRDRFIYKCAALGCIKITVTVVITTEAVSPFKMIFKVGKCL